MTRTYGEVIQRAALRFSSADIRSPRLDAELLMVHAAKTDRAGIIARLGENVPEDVLPVFERLADRRAAREPFAYITGSREFYSLEFFVDSSVLIPRPETEGIIDAALCVYDDSTRLNVLDVGTGSGAIAVTLAKLRPLWSVTGVDISAMALDVARRNAGLHNVGDRVKFVESDLFGSLTGSTYDLIVSNPPYLRKGSGQIDEEVSLFEPEEALYGGDDGLCVVSSIIDQSRDFLNSRGRLIMEIGADQASSARSLVDKSETLRLEKVSADLQGIDRIITAIKTV